MDDIFGSDSSNDEYEPKRSSKSSETSGRVHGADDHDELEDSGTDNPSSTEAKSVSKGGYGGAARVTGYQEEALANSGSDNGTMDRERFASNADSNDGNGTGSGLVGTGLSDSEDDGLPPPKQPAVPADDDLFGSDSDSGGEGAGSKGAAAREGANSPAGDDPFDEDGDDDGGGGGKTLRRLSKGKSKSPGKRKRDGEPGSKEKKKSKKGKKGGKSDKAGKKKRRDSISGENGDLKRKKKKKKQKMQPAGGGQALDNSFEGKGNSSESEVEANLEPEEKEEESDGEELDPRAQAIEDENFIDNTDDNADLLAEYTHDAPPPGSDSEAEEDNKQQYREETVQVNPMDAVLKSMRRRKAQDLSTAERESIAQEFLFKINKAAEDDEEAVMASKPALNKLKLLKTVKATLAKKELQETFLEFDLLGVVKRWLQPYPNGQLPNLTIRKEMLAVVLMLPVQVDHLKRSGIGRVVMGLLKCKEETIENKRVLKELMHRWNRPIYEKETNYRAMRAIQDEPEAMEAPGPGSRSSGGRRIIGAMPQRNGPSRDESVGNILNARAKGMDPTKARVPFSNGYAFAKAPKSRVEGHGRATSQQADTTSRTKLLKKISALSRPVSKG